MAPSILLLCSAILTRSDGGAFTGMLLPAALLVATGYVTCATPYVAVGVLSLAVGAIGIQYGAFVVNHADIAPAYAGVLFGISNTVATMPGFIAPFVIGVITSDVSDPLAHRSSSSSSSSSSRCSSNNNTNHNNNNLNSHTLSPWHTTQIQVKKRIGR